MKIAIEGCAHGELDNIYESIKALEEDEKIRVDLLICCGDFQSVRNESDLTCMAIPQKYYNMRTFYKYYSKEKVAPVLTIFIGGNHEASNYLQELPYGGWVAPNIYYLGYAGVINIGGLRIGGISGIYKGKDYMKGHHELPPYSEDTKRSVYHIRNIEVFRLRQLSHPIDIFISHDWPGNITNHGNVEQLLQTKPFFRDDIESGKLGSPPCAEILYDLQPKFWFSAHLHCKFAAVVAHEDGNKTKFLALDKCLPYRKFLQILDIPHDEAAGLDMQYDLEWLAILQSTDHLFSLRSMMQFMPGKSGQERWDFKPTEEETNNIQSLFKQNLKIPDNFTMTAESYVPGSLPKYHKPCPYINPQTTEFCSKLKIRDPLEARMREGGLNVSQSSHLSEISRNDLTDDSLNDMSLSFNSPLKRSSLSLPKPVNEPEEIFIENIEKSSESLEVELSAEATPVINTVKKLKRRNAEVYNNSDDSGLF